MFDDYEYKKTDNRIKIKFSQEKDEPLYPWEIAGFLSKLNTVYYKFELLNSICSALNHGIKAEDIFIFDRSLPLYQRYSSLNLIDQDVANKIFYDIGLPIPLVPNNDNYKLNLLFQFLKKINSFLCAKHIQSLKKDVLVEAFHILNENGLDSAEHFLLEKAEERAEHSYEIAKKKNVKKDLVTIEAISNSLSKYYSKKKLLVEDLKFLSTLSEDDKDNLVNFNTKNPRRYSLILLEFFRNFEYITRPLVIAKVSEKKYRILGRSLVNKKEQTGLELKEIKKNSPLSAFIEGGVSLYQAIRQEARNDELHKYDVRIKEIEVEAAMEKLSNQKMQNKLLEIEIANKLSTAVENSDVEAITHLPQSFAKQQFIKAYSVEKNNSGRLMSRYGLSLDRNSTELINVKA